MGTGATLVAPAAPEGEDATMPTSCSFLEPDLLSTRLKPALAFDFEEAPAFGARRSASLRRMVSSYFLQAGFVCQWPDSPHTLHSVRFLISCSVSFCCFVRFSGAVRKALRPACALIALLDSRSHRADRVATLELRLGLAQLAPELVRQILSGLLLIGQRGLVHLVRVAVLRGLALASGAEVLVAVGRRLLILLRDGIQVLALVGLVHLVASATTATGSGRASKAAAGCR